MSLFNWITKKIKGQSKKEEPSLLVKKLNSYIPNIIDLLNPPAADNEIDELESITSNKMPEYFRKLYLNHNGEGERVFGVMSGFRLMNIGAIIREWKALQESAYEIISSKSGLINEGECKQGWIPFAEDCGGSFLVMDLEPGVKGFYGKIITIDRNSDISHVISESLEKFFDFIETSFKNGNLNTREDEDIRVIEWKNGHLFDDVIALTGTTIENNIIPLSGFWQEYFDGEILNGCVSTETLAKKRMVYIKSDMAKKYGAISLDILKEMKNLKELIIHAEEVCSFEPIKNIPSLTKLVIGCKSFMESDLEYLVNLQELKQLTFVKLSLNDVHILNEIKTLKCLRLYKINSLNSSSIGCLNNLTELSLEDIDVGDLSYLSNLNKLIKLELKNVVIPNLEFLHGLKNLTILETDTKANDESHIRSFGEMHNLKELVYPVRDLKTIKNCIQLKRIGVDALKFNSLEEITSLNIIDITIFNATSKENAESVVSEFKKYFKIQSYGWKATWKD